MTNNWIWISEIVDFFYKKYARKISTSFYILTTLLLYFTNSFYSFSPKDASLIEFSPLSILLHVFLGLSVLTFILLWKIDPGMIVK